MRVNFTCILSLILLLCGIGNLAHAQSDVSGKVTDVVDGSPVPGVNVVVKGTTNGTVTDADGIYKITAQPSDVLVFSFVGSLSEEMLVEGRNQIDITLSPDITTLGEVVVVGYGTQKKVNVTGAVATVDDTNFKNRPLTNVSAALQGTMAGVTVLQRSGQPGRDGAAIRIRGLGSFNSNDPMILVDGIETSLNDLNPNDIASVSVLKDASSAAVYGTRAANGVVLITTKRGETGAPKINYSFNAGLQKLTRTPKLLGSYDHAKLLNEGYANEGLPALYTADEIEKFRNGTDPNYPNTDWVDLIYKGSGIQQSHSVNVSGGTDAARYMVSFGYLNQKGLVDRANSDRYNLRFNIDSKVSDRITFGVSSAISRRSTNEPTAVYTPGQDDKRYMSWMIRNSFRIPPTSRVTDDNGDWFQSNVDGNPAYWAAEGGNSTEKVTNVFITPFAEVEIIPGLKLKGLVSADNWLYDSKTHNKDFTYSNGTTQGERAVEDRLTRELRVTLQSYLNYTKTFGDHNLHLMLGASRESWEQSYTMAFRSGFPRNDLTAINAGSESADRTEGNTVQARLGSYFGRVNYDYKGKYLFEASGRYDGSSKFASDVRWGLFPSFSAGWRISEESFMQDVSFISNLKMRVSYGTLGNHNIGSYYQYIPLISLAGPGGLGYNFGGVPADGAAQTQSTVKSLTWERTSIFDFGLDAGFMDGKINVEFDYYNKYSDDILAYKPLPATWAFNAPIDNLGAMRNKGVELLVSYKNTTGPWSYNVSGNIGVNNNVVERYPDPTKNGGRIQEEGYQWNAFYGLKTNGLYQTVEQTTSLPKITNAPVKPGDIIFVDENGDGEVSLDKEKDDRVALGSDMPNITYGMTASVTFKGINLSVLGQGNADVYTAIPTGIAFPFENGSRAREDHLDRWTPETPNASNPRTMVNGGAHNKYFSDYLVRDASYFRIKNIQLGYTLPKDLLSKLRVSTVNIYVSGQNLFTFTKLPAGFDPEVTNAITTYPNVKTYSAGINIGF